LKLVYSLKEMYSGFVNKAVYILLKIFIFWHYRFWAR